MKEQQIAKAYAQSIYQLGKEQSVDMASELTKFTEIINSNNDFETLLFMDVFTVEEKMSVVDEVFKKESFSSMTQNLVRFMLTEKRINLFPLVFKEVVVIDDNEKGFLRGVIEGTSNDVDPAFKTKVEAYLKKQIGKDAKLEYQKSDSVTAGYRVTLGDLQLDASLDNQLEQFKKSIL